MTIKTVNFINNLDKRSVRCGNIFTLNKLQYYRTSHSPASHNKTISEFELFAVQEQERYHVLPGSDKSTKE